MVDPTTLNPAPVAEQMTAFVVVPSCVRCGCQALSLRRDGAYRCDGCHRAVVSLEYAPAVYSGPPDRRVRAPERMR